MTRSKILLIAVTALFLTGCTRYAWVKPFGDPATYGPDNYACQQESTQAAPPLYQTYVPYPTYPHPMVMDCRVHHHREYCRARYPYAGFPPEPRTVDLNESARSNLYNGCMQARGWVLQAVEDQR